MKKHILTIIAYLIFASLTNNVIGDETQTEAENFTEQCRQEAEDLDIPIENQDQYILDCIIELSPANHKQQQLKNITEQCHAEADNLELPSDEYEQYVQNCILQQTDWDDDSSSDHVLDIDTDSAL